MIGSTHWSVVFFRTSVSFFKDRCNVIIFQDRWKRTVINRYIKKVTNLTSKNARILFQFFLQECQCSVLPVCICLYWHIDNPGIIRILTYLKPDRYSEPSQRFKMERFVKIIKSYNYFSKALYHRSLTGFCTSSLNKYSLTCSVALRYVFYQTYSESCYIQNSVSSNAVELRNRVTQNDVTLGVTNSTS